MRPSSITVTFHRSYNYGATLQAYALQKALLSVGFDNHILDFYRNPFEPQPILSGNLRIDCARMILRVLELLNIRKKKRLVASFDEFTNNNILLTKCYSSLDELMREKPEADCYFAGSDQIIDLSCSEFTLMRNMLGFVEDSRKKYTYAASMASYQYNSDELNKLSELLRDFEVVSLREEKSKDVLKTVLNANYRVDIDPVFLLSKEQWELLVKHPSRFRKYILYFQVNANPISNDVIKKLKVQYGLPVVCLQTNPLVRIKADHVVLDASPEEFLGWIYDAEFVVTTSFHGTAFSLIFEKEFFTLSKATSNPYRMKELLKICGLEDRMILSINDVTMVNSIDWNKVKDRINVQRKRAMDYLQNVYDRVFE